MLKLIKDFILRNSIELSIIGCLFLYGFNNEFMNKPLDGLVIRILIFIILILGFLVQFFRHR